MAPTKKTSSMISYPMPLSASAGQKAAPVHAAHTSVHATYTPTPTNQESAHTSHTPIHDAYTSTHASNTVGFPPAPIVAPTSHRPSLLRKRGRDSDASTAEESETPRSRQRTSSILSGTIRRAPATIANVLMRARRNSKSSKDSTPEMTHTQDATRPAPLPLTPAPRARKSSEASTWSLETVQNDRGQHDGARADSDPRARVDSDASTRSSSTLRDVARPRAPTPQTITAASSARSSTPASSRASTPSPSTRSTTDRVPPKKTLKRVRGSISDRDAEDVDGEDGRSKRARVKREAGEAEERRRSRRDSTSSVQGVFLAFEGPVQATRPAELNERRKLDDKRKTAPLPARTARRSPEVADKHHREDSTSDESADERKPSTAVSGDQHAADAHVVEVDPPRFKDSYDLVHLTAHDYNISVVFLKAPIFEEWDVSDDDEIACEAAFHLTLKDDARWRAVGLAPPDVKLIDIRCYSKTHGVDGELSKRWTCRPTGLKLFDCRLYDGIMVDSDWRRTNLYDEASPSALDWQNTRGWAKPVIVNFPAKWFAGGQSRVFVLDVVASFGRGRGECLRAKADITVGNLKWENVKTP
ncbi:hypothetical protein BD626DRAFT_411757 [Schizophyllum amplum]|uniref:Uncharacterized protein n=1 Tax=Schizophyllum amplum TaxID=97359 RepID=A0A550BYH9_9AGAR|nr:hypothetical protein BD626DRAFT_411757 [Auriculariopsis ampla]